MEEGRREEKRREDASNLSPWLTHEEIE